MRWVIVVILVIPGYAQIIGVRYDNIAYKQVGGLVTGIRNASITVCTSSSTISTCAANPVDTYTDGTLTTKCSQTVNPTAQVVLPQSSTCQLTGDTLGNFGFWVPAGNYGLMIAGPGVSTRFLVITLSSGGNGSTTGLGLLVTANGLSCNGTTDDTTALQALLTGIGAAPTKLVFSVGQCLLSNITLPSNITLDFSPGGALKPVTGQTITILGPIIAPLQKIFFNATAGLGTILLTDNTHSGGTALTDVYPEWWGAVPDGAPGGSGSNETGVTAALQAAIIGAFGNTRTNASFHGIYNRTLWFSGLYFINGELQTYHMLGFRWRGVNKLYAGIQQDATNKRIIDGQSVAYGNFENMTFRTSATQTVPLIDLDYDTSQGTDLATQFITFQDVSFFGNTLGQIGVLISKSGGGAQGSNVVCYNCIGAGFSEAVWQVGGNNTGINAGRLYAQNAIDIGWYQGDMQANPHYGLVSYGGGDIFVKEVTMENGFASQTGFDMYCEGPVSAEYCLMENVRSESRRLIAGGNLRVFNSYTINQCQYPVPGNSMGAGTIICGSNPGWDGAYYKVTVNGNFGGVGTPSALESATAGGATSITNGSASYTVNAFTNFIVSILSGTGTGETCLVTSNSATVITCSGGWLTKFSQLAIVNPDATSKYVVEPNWGTQTVSGGATFAALGENGIEGTTGAVSVGATLIKVDVPGDPIRATGWFKGVSTTRPDWLNVGFPLDDSIIQSDYDGVVIDQTVGVGGTTKYQAWSFPRNGGGATAYSDYSQKNVGTLSYVWSHGGAGGGSALPDAWIGLNGLRLATFTFATLPSTSPLNANGVMVYCSDCKNVTDDTTGTFDSVAASGGHGTNVLRENGAWRVH